jgi:hypothetical protein
MSTKTKSIFSGMGGLIAALAGLVTVGVGLLTIGSNLGWFGSDNDKDTKVQTGQDANDEGTPAAEAGSGGSAAASAPEFRLDRTKITFEPGGPTEQTVRLTNEGSPFTPEAPALEGSDPDEFQVTDRGCAGRPLRSGSSCQVTVTFSPSKMGTYDAKVVIPISDSSSQAEIAVDGEKGLL